MLKALKNALEKPISTKKLINMAKFVLKNNFFELNNSVKQQVSIEFRLYFQTFPNP